MGNFAFVTIQRRVVVHTPSSLAIDSPLVPPIKNSFMRVRESKKVSSRGCKSWWSSFHFYCCLNFEDCDLEISSLCTYSTIVRRIPWLYIIWCYLYSYLLTNNDRDKWPHKILVTAFFLLPWMVRGRRGNSNRICSRQLIGNILRVKESNAIDTRVSRK